MRSYEDGFRDGLAAANEVALDLETRWRKSAQKVRDDGTFTVGWFKKRTFVAAKWEQAAKDTESAADGIKAIRRIVDGLNLSAADKRS